MSCKCPGLSPEVTFIPLINPFVLKSSVPISMVVLAFKPSNFRKISFASDSFKTSFSSAGVNASSILDEDIEPGNSFVNILSLLRETIPALTNFTKTLE